MTILIGAEWAARLRSADAADSPVLEVEGLVKDYGLVHAVQGIDLDVRRREIFGFLGPNSSGKTTTIRCVLDLLRPTAGRVEVFGLDSRRDGVAARRRIMGPTSCGCASGLLDRDAVLRR